MKNTILALLVMFLPAFAIAHMGEDRSVYEVNTDNSTVVWKGTKVTGEHHGTIQVESGELIFNEEGRLTGGEFTIDMSTIENKDMEGSKGEVKLENHLKSDDFFSVETYPTSTFVITRAIPYGTSGDYKIEGDLTIKGITKPIKFMAHVDMSNDMKATAEIEIDRSEYNVRYGSGSFFDNLGDKAISDMFTLDVELAFNQTS